MQKIVHVSAASAACLTMRSQWHCSMEPAAELVLVMGTDCQHGAS
jgi:hypothetical protein